LGNSPTRPLLIIQLKIIQIKEYDEVLNFKMLKIEVF